MGGSVPFAIYTVSIMKLITLFNRKEQVIKMTEKKVIVETYLMGPTHTKHTAENVIFGSIREEGGFLRYTMVDADQWEEISIRLKAISHYIVIHEE
jgi:hypothetical protein